jgi:hypothetical protein
MMKRGSWIETNCMANPFANCFPLNNFRHLKADENLPLLSTPQQLHFFFLHQRVGDWNKEQFLINDLILEVTSAHWNPVGQ